MTQDEIIDMAKLAGWEMDDSCVLSPQVLWYIYQGQLEAFAKLVEERAAAKEREAIAQFIDSTELGSLPEATAMVYARLLKSYSTAIRARGEA